MTTQLALFPIVVTSYVVMGVSVDLAALICFAVFIWAGSIVPLAVSVAVLNALQIVDASHALPTAVAIVTSIIWPGHQIWGRAGATIAFILISPFI